MLPLLERLLASGEWHAGTIFDTNPTGNDFQVGHDGRSSGGGVDYDSGTINGLNVLHGPNELGKSTLVTAIRAALLLQDSASAAGSFGSTPVIAVKRIAASRTVRPIGPAVS